MRTGTASPVDVRAEYEEFFRAAYPSLVSQLHAITGDRMWARAAVETAFDGCWRQWSAVRRSADPMTWVRCAAVRVAGQGRAGSGGRRRAAAVSIATDTDEGVVLAALQKLPWPQRQAVVLHYMADVPVEGPTRGGTNGADAVDRLLDTGFDALVAILGWPNQEAGANPDPRYGWTAEALGDTAMLLAADVTVPDPGSVLQRAAVLRWAKRAAPIAVSAACVSSFVVLATQLGPGGTVVPRPPTIHVAEPGPGDVGGGYTEARSTPVDGRDAVGGVASPLPYLGVKFLAVARSSTVEDFGVSAPQLADASARTQVGTSGSSSGAAAITGTGTSTAGPTSVGPPVPGGVRIATTPGSGSSGGTEPTTSPVTIPPIPTIAPPPVTTDPPVVTITTEPVMTTTPAEETTTATEPTTTTETEPTTSADEEGSTISGGA